MQKETDPPTIGLLITIIIMWLISIPLFLYFAYLCGLSLLMIYEKVYLWAKSGINIDLNSYGCITQPSKYCENLMSFPPFSFISKEFSAWLASPHDWIGVHSIIKVLLESIPIWLFSLVITGFLACAFFFIIIRGPTMIKQVLIDLKEIYNKK